MPAVKADLSAAREYVRTTAASIYSAEQAQVRKMGKGKQITFDPKKPKKLTVFVTTAFPTWQQKYIDLMAEVWDPATGSQKIDDKELNGRIGKMGEMKKAMPFVQALKKRLRDGEPAEAVLARKLSFDEKVVLQNMIPGLTRTAGLAAVDLIEVQEGSTQGKNVHDGSQVEIRNPIAEGAVPGQPTFSFENVEA